jgi:hypothetical protein
MKLLLIALFLTLAYVTANAADTVIKLQPIKNFPWDYGPQLIEKFTKLLTTDENLKKSFAKYEMINERGGRYNGSTSQYLVLRSSSVHDLQESGGMTDYKQTVVIYYTFPEGLHGGREMKDGVFAVFEISGKATFTHKEGDSYELLAQESSARFLGFRKSIAVGIASTDKE